MSTPGRRRALKALAATKRQNRSRVEAGKSAEIAGKTVSSSAYKRRYGANAANHEGGLVHMAVHDCCGGLKHEAGTKNCGQVRRAR